MIQDSSLYQNDPRLVLDGGTLRVSRRLFEDTMHELLEARECIETLSYLLREARAFGDYPRQDLGERIDVALKECGQ